MKKDPLGEIVLKRKGSGNATLKEKFVVIYDSFFNGVDISNSSPQFWEELFLLKVNLPFLERCFVLTIEEKLLEMKLIFNKIFYHSVKFLQDKNHIKIARSIETQEALLRGIFRKKFSNFGIHTLTLICGIEDAEIYFTDFLNSVNSLLIDPEIPLNFKKELINLLVIITTATDNLNSNTILEYFKLVDLFPSILQFITNNQIDLATFTSGIFVLELLANYQKFETKNPYFDSIKNLHQNDCILPIAQLFTQQLQNMISHHQSFSPNNISFMQKITSIFSFWSPSTTLESNVNIINNNNNNNNNNINNNQLVNNVSIQRMNSSLLTLYEFYPAISQFLFINSVNQQENYNDVLVINKKLISNFLKVCSYILVDIQDIHHAYYSKICLIILLQMSEDIHTSKLLHDVSNRLDFTLVTPHKGINENPPVVIILDLLVQFMNNNLKKNMQFDLFLKSLSIIQRIICYEKKSSTQLKYHWKYLWDSLFRVVKFISVPKWFSIPEVSQISLGITTIFNLFITYGDIFLSSNSDYDELYYELIHQSKLLQQFTILAENSSARILSQQLENINIIIRHFSAKIDQWQDENPTLTLSQEQVILIIKSNYLSLKLNLLDGIDTFDTYSENPKENSFFRQFLRLVIFDYKTTLEVKNIDMPIK